MRDFTRPHHRRVAELLDSLDASLLAECQCYFGGGTRIVLGLEEYRQSLDVDFLCANIAGYRTLRSAISENSLGEIMANPLPLLREVRADIYGIRTFVQIANCPIKFEIILEARIPLSAMAMPTVPVLAIDQKTCVAEKCLANSDRGNDRATLSRDVIDLAFMVARWPEQSVHDGVELAESAYGVAIRRGIRRSLDLLNEPKYRRQCISELGINDSAALRKGLTLLSTLHC